LKDISLVCVDCGKKFASNQAIWRCECGGLLDVTMEVEFSIDEIKKRPPNLWRYFEALPINNPSNIISFSEGFTPLLPMNFDGKVGRIKQDHLFPSGSYKDRGATVLISVANEIGVKKVVEDSSGNAGCAIAAYCAQANIECDIYVPANTSPGKLAQINQYGANLHLIPGSREDTAHAVLNAAETTYYASHSWNPYFFQGTKTFAYEIWEQNNWKAPEAIILPVGNGTLLLGTWIGFKDLFHAGLIEKLPRIFGVQTKNCAPLHQMFQEKSSHLPKIESLPSLAEGIAIAEPVRAKQILQAIRETNGAIVAVSEQEIKTSLISIHRQGFYIEPTAAAAIAAIPNLLQTYPEISDWISVFTGHGLKSTEKIISIYESTQQKTQ
jgi:threonine synthase